MILILAPNTRTDSDEFRHLEDFLQRIVDGTKTNCVSFVLRIGVGWRHRICGSSHVVGTGCEVAPETPPENLRALVAYARDHSPEDPPTADAQTPFSGAPTTA